MSGASSSSISKPRMLTSHRRWSLPIVVPATRTRVARVPQLDADEARVVARRGRAFLAHLDAALGRDERGVDVVHRPVGAALEGSVERRDREEPGVVVREAAVDGDHDLLGRTVRKLHRDAAEPRRERHVRPEHLEVVGADHRDVDGVRDQAALERRGDLLGDDHAGAVLRLPGRRREMRRDDDVVELEQRAGIGLARRRRRAPRPRPGPSEAPSSSASSSSSAPRAALTIRTPARIASNAAASIEPRVSGGQRQVQREEVGDGVDVLGRLDAVGAELAEPLGRDERVVRDDAHAEPERAAGDLLPDPAEAEDAESLAGELDAAVRVALPAALLERGVRLRDVARERDEQADRVLGGGDDRRLGRVRDDDAAPGRRLDVDVVDPTPARPITFSRSACSITSAVSLVAERTTIAS